MFPQRYPLLGFLWRWRISSRHAILQFSGGKATAASEVPQKPRFQCSRLELLISGRTSDGQEGEYRISVKLLADVKSPFREDKTVVAVIWQTELSHSQALYYNNDTKKLERPNTKLADKLVADAQLLVERFIDDVQKANPPKR